MADAIRAEEGPAAHVVGTVAPSAVGFIDNGLPRSRCHRYAWSRSRHRRRRRRRACRAGNRTADEAADRGADRGRAVIVGAGAVIIRAGAVIRTGAVIVAGA